MDGRSATWLTILEQKNVRFLFAYSIPFFSHPPLGHHDGANHRDEQQDRSNFKRQHVALKNCVADGFRISHWHFVGGIGQVQACACYPQREKHLGSKDQGEHGGHIFLSIELNLAESHIEIHEHDDEDEEDHDAADVENDLNYEEKFGLELKENASCREQS